MTNDLDVYIGDRVRKRRSVRRMSQKELGAALGITCQQIQKYECAKNRISVSSLCVIAQTLGVPITYFVPNKYYRSGNDE